MDQEPSANVLQRVAVLEKMNRRYRVFNALLFSAILIVAIAGARMPFNDGIMIRDHDGRDRAGMWVDEQDKRRAVMEMIDHGGNVRFVTSIEPDGLVHTVYRDTNGKLRIDIGINGQNQVFLNILDPQGNVVKHLAH